MLPITHGNEFTRLHVFLYTLVLFAADAAAVRLRHERRRYLAAALRAGRHVHRLRLAALARATPTTWPGAPSASRSSTCRCCSPRCWSTTTSVRGCSVHGPRFEPPAPGAAPFPGAGAGGRRGARRMRSHHGSVRRRSSAAPTSPEPNSGARWRCRMSTGGMRTLDDFKGKVTVLFFGYTQCPDVCPTTHGRTGRGQEDRSARTGTACRASSSPSIRSATRPRF